MMNSLLKTTTLVALCSLTACASIIQGSSDKINVSTVPPSRASCTASNERGSSSAYAPGEITGLNKSKTDLKVDCIDAATGARGSRSVESSFDLLTILGGLIGLAVDASTGAMWDYPQEVSVPLAYAAPAAAPAASAPAAPAYAPAPATVIAPAVVPNPAPAYAPPAGR